VGPDPGAEHEIVGCREHRPLADPGEFLRRLVSERDRAALAALWTRLLTRRVAALDVDALRLEVDVPPAQRERLAHPQSGEAGHDHERCVLFVLCSATRDLVIG